MTYPTISPELTLDFAKSEQLDPRIAFTRASTGTYLDSDGLIKTAPSGVARVEYDSSGNSLGLLVEESRTNSLQYSTELDNAYYDLATGLTKTANNAVSPDGNTTALLVTEDTSTGEHVFGKSTNVSVSNNCMSLFVKPNGKTKVGLAQGGSIADLVVFDLTGSGSVVSGAGLIEKQANGWYRITNVRSGNGNKVYFYLLNDSDNAKSYTGDGTSGCWIWGYQKEAGTFPTSIIPTAGSTATRAADVASITGTNFSNWYNGGEGTFTAIADHSQFANYQLTVEGADATAYKDFSMGMSDTNVQFFSSRYSFAANNVFGSSVISSGVVFKQAGGYSSAGTAAAFDGTLGTVSSTSAAEGATRMGIGSRLGGAPAGLFLNGHISRLSYYDRRASDAELQSLTS